MNDPASPVDETAAAERLAAALAIPTVSGGAGPPGPALRRLRDHLAASFPRVHDALGPERVSDHALLFSWPGSDASREPLLLLAHQDVVPVLPGTESDWTHPPFEGRVADGFVWGRGALDDKGRLLATLEALESLLAAGFRPRRGVLFAVGHDEETGGAVGAARLAALLSERGVVPWMVLDEGNAVVEGVVPGVARPVAMVGLAEKGYLSVELVARGAEGHASIPPPESAVVVLARAIDRVAARPFPAAIDGPTRLFLEATAGERGGAAALAFRGLPATAPLLVRALAGTPGTNAMIRTTVAPTMLEGSVADNVLPKTARAIANLRIHPRDTTDGALDRVREAVDDPRVEVRPAGGTRSEPSPAAPAAGPAWDALVAAIGSAFPDAFVAPSLSIVLTDSRHYLRLGGPVYRFAPYALGPDDLARIHGTDERIAVDAYARMIGFYRDLIERACGGGA